MSARTTASWARLGDLEALLDPAQAAALMSAAGLRVHHVRPDYIRLKPGAGALVGFQLAGTDAAGRSCTLPGYARTHPGDRAAEIARKWRSLRPTDTPLGSGITLLPGGRSVLFLFPNDARLRGLRFVAGMEKLKRELTPLAVLGGRGLRVRGRRSHLEPVRYKPERRYIARARLALIHDPTGRKEDLDVFIREFPDSRGARVAAVAAALGSCGQGPRVPRALGTLRGGRLFVEERVAGEPLLPLVLSGQADAGALAGLLVALHRTELPPCAGPVADRLAGAREAVEALRTLGGETASLAAELLAQLEAAATATLPAATIHGDCHLHQFLLEGGAPVMVDFERTGTGPALLDLGTLQAHLEALCLRHPQEADRLRGFGADLAGAYARGSGRSLEALPAFTAAALLDQALLPFRRREDGWEVRTPALLERAREVLAAGPAGRRTPVHSAGRFFAAERTPGPSGLRWRTFYPRPRGAWPGVLTDGLGRRAHGLLDPATGSFQQADPGSDAGLPGLASCLHRGELVSYRPGRRAVLREHADGAGSWIKVVPPSKVRRLLRRLEAFREALAGCDPAPVAIPELQEVDAGRGVLAFAPLPGTALHARLVDQDAGRVRALRTAARALAALHSVHAPGPAVPEAPGHGRLETWAQIAATCDPEPLPGLLELLPELQGTPGPACHLVHGDLHDRNILLDGTRTGLLDLDAAGRGDPASDAGNLAAHVILRALQRGDAASAGRREAALLLRTWSGSLQEPGGEASLHLAVARTLFRLACLYRFRRRWRTLGPVLLEEARGWIPGRP